MEAVHSAFEFLVKELACPRPDEAISPDKAVLAAKLHFDKVRQGRYGKSFKPDAYLTDYQRVLTAWKDETEAKPVLVTTDDGAFRVARYLVGLRRGNKVGGFIAINALDGSLLSTLMWTPEFDPLWQLDGDAWDAATSVNDLPALEELLTPDARFTAGIPVDPRTDRFSIVGGIVDVLRLKTQAERRVAINTLNAAYSSRFGLRLRSHLGRRNAAGKCLSVAASYLADWWRIQAGLPLPSYTNHIGGQLEYGTCPRSIEALYFERRTRSTWFGRRLGNWKHAPLARDRVTGERIPYSTRGYARILCETEAGTRSDPLVGEQQYCTNDNPFAMDQRPMVFQVFRNKMPARRVIRKDIRGSRNSSYPFSVPTDHGQKITAKRLAEAIDTYGPLLAQHLARSTTEEPLGIGVHNCMLIGYTEHEGQTWFAYAETFGNASHQYLEDSFLGPSYRIMPLEYFYQAIAFPHHLYLDAEILSAHPDRLEATIHITTNRRRDPVPVDVIHLLIDGKHRNDLGIQHVEGGTYRLSVRLPDANHVEVRAVKNYFADVQARNGFGVAIQRTGSDWIVSPGNLEPINLGRDWKDP